MSTIRIRPSKGWSPPRLKEIWEYRDLLYFLAWRDIKVRYKQTVLGAAWAVLQPLVLMAIFSVVLGRLAGLESDGFPYTIFVYTALVPWTLFSQVLVGSSNSLVDNLNIVTKAFFPRLILPLAVSGPFLVDFAISFCLLLGMMIFYGIAATTALVWIPLFTLIALASALGVGTFLAAVNVRYRDVRYAVPFLVQVWLFVSPVAYSSDLVPPAWRPIYALNPMTGVIEGFRWAVLGVPENPWGAVSISAAVTVLLVVVALGYFHRVERTFADVI